MVYDARAADPVGFNIDSAIGDLGRALETERIGFTRHTLLMSARASLMEASEAAVSHRDHEADRALMRYVGWAGNVAAVSEHDAPIDRLRQDLIGYRRRVARLCPGAAAALAAIVPRDLLAISETVSDASATLHRISDLLSDDYLDGRAFADAAQRALPDLTEARDLLDAAIAELEAVR